MLSKVLADDKSPYFCPMGFSHTNIYISFFLIFIALRCFAQQDSTSVLANIKQDMFPKNIHETQHITKRIFFNQKQLYSQDSTIYVLSKQQKIIRSSILFGSLSLYTIASLTFLDIVWYRQYPRSAFHFFNDNAQWNQMDKWGHAWTTYNSGRLIMQAMRWAGFSVSPFHADLGGLVQHTMQWAGFTKIQSYIIGESFGLLYMSSIEIMDGFSKRWGFSWGDELANAGGSMLYSLQQYYWGDQRFQLKFSYHLTNFPSYRPNELGSNFAEQILKDYNGQTYWLSLNIASFLKTETKFPKWFNLAFGYGASNMIGGRNNVIVYADGSTSTNSVANQSILYDKNGNAVYFYPYRKFYFSLDIDFTKIKVNSKFLRGLFSVFNCFKIPFPTMEFSKHGIVVFPVYF